MGKSKVIKFLIPKLKLIYKVFFILFFIAFFFLFIIQFDSCQLETHQIKSLKEINLIKSDINFIEHQISVYPETSNLFCLGKIKEIRNYKNSNNLLYDEKIIDLTIYTSKTLKQFVYFLFIIIQFFNLNIFSKIQNQIASILLSIFYNLYFFTNTINLILFIILTQLVIYFYFADENKTLNTFSISRNKNYLYLLLLIFNMFVAYEMIFEEYFFIGSYLINYEYGFMRRGLLGSILFSLNLPSTFSILISATIILVLLYIYFQYLFIKILEKNDNIYLILIGFSPLIIFYQIVNTTHSVNSNLLGGEFLGLLTIVYAAYIKEDQNIYNILNLLVLFNISIYTHEINVLTLIMIHLILNNRKVNLLITFSASIFSYLYLVNYSSFLSRFDPLCKQFESLNIRENICLGGLSNAASDQIDFGYSIIKDIDLINTVFTPENRSYIYSILFFMYFISKIQISKKILGKSVLLFSIYLPVFLVTVDWGRWLTVIFTSLVVLYAVSDIKNIKLFTKYDLFLYLSMLFTLKHFGTRGVSYIQLDFEYLLNINFYMLLFILLKKSNKNLTINVS